MIGILLYEGPIAPECPQTSKDVSHLIISKEVCSPLRKAAWVDELANHPDKCFTEYILQGIQSGFRIDYDRHNYLVPAASNLNVANPQAVTEYLSREVAQGRMWKIHIREAGLHTQAHWAQFQKRTN